MHLLPPYAIIDTMAQIRKRCTTPGCVRMGRNKGIRDGKVYFGSKCRFCHRKGIIGIGYEQYILGRKDNKKCERCGWNEGPCDRHRVIPSLGYIDSNIIILCPNCHRLETFNIIDIQMERIMAGKK